MEFFWSCILCLCVASFFFVARLKSAMSRNPKLPPGPKPLPIIGNLLDLGENYHKSLAELAKVHGPIMSLKLGQVTAVVVSSAAMAKEVLQTNDQDLCNRAIPDVLRAFSHDELGLPWIPVSPLWRSYRKICNNTLFAAKILDANEKLRRKKVEDLVEIVRKSAASGEAVDVGRLGFMTTLNLLSNTIFSVDLADPNSESARKFTSSVWGFVEEVTKPNLGDYFPALRKLDIQGMRKRMKIHMGKILNLLDAMTKERMKQQQLNPDSVPNNDMLHYLLTNIEDSEIGKNEIEHLLLVLFVAGADTTSMTLQWAMAELLKNPEKLAKAEAEIRQVLGKNKLVDEVDIPKLPYLQAVVKEACRLHPVVPLLLPRKAQREVEIGGFMIPKDAQLLVNAWAIGRDPRSWPENPELFEPERFLGSKIDVRGRSFELIPFGGGRRICPGLPLAMRMLHLMLGSLINFFDWKLEDECEVNMDDKLGVPVEMVCSLRAIPSLI